MQRRNSLLWAGAAITALLLLVAVLAPLLAPYDPNEIDPTAILERPSAAHWAGTDELGRDLLSRILWGARPSLGVAFGIVLIASIPGTLIGGLSGLIGGIFDAVLMRLVEMVLSLPGLVIALALTTALGPSLINLTIALGILAMPFFIRMARGEALALAQRPFVLAARSAGATQLFLVVRHIVPNLAATAVVLASVALSGALLSASALSFIGLGAQPPMAEWGALLHGGQRHVLDAWWYGAYPGLAIMIAALGFNLMGDGFRDLLDPNRRS